MKSLKILCFVTGIFVTATSLPGCVNKPKDSIRSPVFSPDGKFIVFSYCHDGHESIYRAKTDGGELKRLVVDAGSTNFDPAYSPDGSKIAFSSIKKHKARKDADLYIMNSDGTNIKKLTSNPDSDVSPFFSPDGKRIYFLRATEFAVRHSPTLRNLRFFDVYSINIDGTNLSAITDLDGWMIENPSISPDGKTILVRMYTGLDSDSLWAIPVDNPKEIRPIRPSHMKRDDFYDPKFSPDGKSIIFIWGGSQKEYSGLEIYLMNLETKKIKKITNSGFYIKSPSFSYDGTKIVFVNVLNIRTPEEKYELWQINADGSNPHHIELGL